MALTNHILPDSPTNNFATPNSLVVSNLTLSDGNLKIVTPAALTNNVLSTIQFPNEGKWFFEILYISYGHHNSGIINKSTNTTYTVYQNGFYTTGANPSTLSANSYSASSNSVIGLLINFENVQATVTIYINGTSVGGPFNIDAGEYFAVFNDGASATGGTQIVNFGQDNLFGGTTLPSGAGSNTPDNGIGTFAFSVPTGAKALCTANLPDPAIDPAVDDLPEDHFKAVLYTGTSSADSGTTFDNLVGFKSDLVWIKERGNATSHQVFDSVRGTDASAKTGKSLATQSTAAEDSVSGSYPGELYQFTDNGFKINRSTSGRANSSGANYCAWCWKAGGNSNTFNINGTGYSTYSALQTANTSLPASSTSGMIVPSGMSINTDAGFSIVSYVSNNTNTGSVAHGLNQKPDIVIQKNIDTASDWLVLTNLIDGSNDYLLLNAAASAGSAAGGANATTFVSWDRPTGDNLIVYCWHSVEGYSKFGRYTGNGSTDGPFVYTGFRPAFVICKCTSDTTTTHTSWAMYDNARDSSNVMNKVLYANRLITEGYRGDASTAATDIYIDFLSNGFKVRSTKEEINDDGETYIFMAFAEQPFKFSNAR